jgi:BNR/Asp-box repeat
VTDDDLRDHFGDELTDALRARSRRAPTAELPVPVVSPAPRPRVGTRTRVLTAALAAAIVATGIAVIAFRDHGSPAVVATEPTSTAPTTTPLAASASGVADWTWVTVDHGWALVRRPCGATVCMALRTTSDGGRTWTAVKTPPVLDTYAQHDVGTTCAAQMCVVGVRFATGRIGWLFGPALLQTTDGGRTWTRVKGPDVLDVEASGGVAVRLTTADWAACGPVCANQIERERLATNSWQPVSTPVVSSPSLIILGSDAYIVSVPNLAGAGRTVLRRSTDSGRTWTEATDPCPGGGGAHVTTSASAAPDGVFVVLCSARQPPTTPFVRISTDGGKTFGARRPVPVAGAGAVRAASAQTLAVGYRSGGANAVLVSRDGGRTWHTTLRAAARGSGAVTLGWENATTARASFDSDAIWTTRDGGLDWTRNPVTP